MDSNLLVIKPSFIITNTVDFESGELDLFNFFLKIAYKQLEENHLRDTFTISVKEINDFNPYLNTRKKIKKYFEDIYNKEFNFNILGKDKSIEANVKSRIITMMQENKNGTLEIAIEPLTVNALRTMVVKKTEINNKINLHPYVTLPLTKKIKFYPSKVIFEICKDYEGYPVPKIDIEDFKQLTNTVDKYKKDYNNKVIKKIESDLKEYIENFQISLIKEGRRNKWVKIESEINKKIIYFKDFYSTWLIENNFKDTTQNKKIAETIYRQKYKGEI